MQSKHSSAPRSSRPYIMTAAILWVLLIALQGIWYGYLQAPAGSVLPMLLISIGPLLVPALLLRRPIRALLLVSMIALWYFTHGIMVLWSDPSLRLLATFEALISFGLICLSLPLTKKRQRVRRI